MKKTKTYKIFEMAFEKVHGQVCSVGDDLKGVDYLLEIPEEADKLFQKDMRKVAKTTDAFLNAQELLGFWLKRHGKKVKSNKTESVAQLVRAASS